MKFHSLNTVALAFILIGLVVPTGAVVVDGADLPWNDSDRYDGITLKPADGPNGKYASFEDDQLKIDLATPGVNPNGRTVIKEVFVITNNGDTAMEVWVTHDATDRVTFKAGTDPIQGKSDRIAIPADGHRLVGFTINSSGVGEDTLILRNFTLHAHQVHEDDDGDQQAAQPSQPPPTPTPTQTPTATPTPAEPEEAGEVVVELGDQATAGAPPDPGGEEGVTIRDIDIEELEARERSANIRTRPKAVAEAQVRTKVETTAQTRQQRSAIDKRVKAAGADALTTVNEDVVLSGTQSIVGSMDAVDRDRKIVRAVDIQVPPDRRDQPGTVRIEVSKAKLGTTDPAKARIGHLTDEGWQLLPTRVVSERTNSFVFQARTPSFSPFAVFADNEIEYTWTVDNQTVSGQEIETRFEEPGIYNASLTVTDSFEQSDTTTMRILVNDPPQVTIEEPRNLTAGKPVTLEANVTNEVGNATVTWSFPDGTQKVGREVTHTFEAGDRTVRVVVEDEFGASSEAEATLTVPGAAGAPIVDRIAREIPFELRAAGIVLLSILLVLLARRLLTAWSLSGIRGMIAIPRRGRGPRIITCDDPTVDVRNRQFRIGELHVEDPEGDLETIDIAIEDGRGNEVAHKAIDLRGESDYRSRNVVVPPMSRVYVREDDEYTVRIRATDARARTDALQRSGVGVPGATPG